MKFTLSKTMLCRVPKNSGACATYAQEELIRLLSKLGISVEIIGYNRGLTLTLGDADKISTVTLKEVRSNGFVSQISSSGIALAANTEKGLLNAVYSFIEDLGITFILPGEKNEFLAEGVPFALECGTAIHNTRSLHAGIVCEFAVVTEEDYRGEEWMAYFAKLRFDTVFRHAGGHIHNDPKFGFIYGDGAHEFHHLLPKRFKNVHRTTNRQSQPDDFGGERVNDVNFCSASEVAWQEIEKNFRKYASSYQKLDHLTLELADLPGGGHCFCGHCRNYSPSDLQAVIMNRFAEIAEKLGLKCTIQMNAYHDTMMPSKLFPPRRNIRIEFIPRERCWGHALDDSSCARNSYYMQCLKNYQKESFPHIKNRCYVGYYNDQVLFRGMYPFIPDVISADLKCLIDHGINNFMSLQVGGQILQIDYNLLYLSMIQWDESLDKKKFCQDISRRIAGKNATALEKYLLQRSRIFQDVLKWCDVDSNICHLDYRWLKEDDSPFFRNMVKRLHKNAVALKRASDELRADIKTTSIVVKKLLMDEVARAEFESEVIEGMSLQQKAYCKMPEVRRTRDPLKLANCHREFTELIAFLKKSVKTGDKIGIGTNAYYGRLISPWLLNDIAKKDAWCDEVGIE
ncbi:MAG: DUF4838 domain-containing protein [Victivallales bacterium]|jgi:hypothetical protein|nr:DUF4838 domain-containing protein [Victivallales bacterium]